MNTLALSPLPSARTEEESNLLQMEREGFVDEAVVAALVSGPRYQRSTACPEDLALAVDDMDFAGWQLSQEMPPRGAEVPPQVIEAIVRRATPPAIREPGIGSPHRGKHRWWLAGLAGIFSTLLVALLLINLSGRLGPDSGAEASPRPWTSVKPGATQDAGPESAPANLASSPTVRH